MPLQIIGRKSETVDFVGVFVVQLSLVFTEKSVYLTAAHFIKSPITTALNGGEILAS